MITLILAGLLYVQTNSVGQATQWSPAPFVGYNATMDSSNLVVAPSPVDIQAKIDKLFATNSAYLAACSNIVAAPMSAVMQAGFQMDTPTTGVTTNLSRVRTMQMIRQAARDIGAAPAP